MIHVYIATCLERRDEARRLASLLRDAGCEIESRWHEDDTATRDAERTLTPADARALARDNVLGVRSCNFFVCIADARCRGTLVEYAIANEGALDAGRTMVVVGDSTLLGPMASLGWDYQCDSIADVPHVYAKAAL